MLVLLPPSEGKTPPADGAPLDLSRLTAPDLTGAREEVLTTLAAVSARPDAVEALGVGASLGAEVARNTMLREAPAGPARSVYTGVLYATAGLGSLDGPAAERAERTVRTVSALFGVVGPEDHIPAYRLAMSTALPGLGPLTAFWQTHLARTLDDGVTGRLVVDLRSAAYAAAWAPPGPTVPVRVLREVDGRRTVVSHWAKHARGGLLRHLLVRDGTEPTTPGELLDAALELVGTGPFGVTAPGLRTSELVTAELTTDRRGPTLTLVVH